MIPSLPRSEHAGWKAEHVTTSQICSTIVLVNDDKASRVYHKRLFEKSYHIIEAAHGHEGVARAQKHVPDLIISSIMMPYLDGFDLCRMIKLNPVLKHIPVLLLSEENTMEYHLLGLEVGADLFLGVPYSDELLLAQVKNVLQNRKNIRSHYSRKRFVEPTNISVLAPEKRFLNQVKAIVEAEMGDAGFNLSAFAEKMHRCERQLQRKFKAFLGMTPMEYVRVMRLKRAVQLIEQGAGTISEIAFQVGFKNPRHFTSSFRKFFDVTPTQYMQATENAQQTTWKKHVRVHWSEE